MQQIEINSTAWHNLLSEVAANYQNGELLTHDYLRQRFGLEKLKLEDFESVDEFVNGLNLQQFAYMTLVDTLRWQLLEEEKMYLKNVRGDGYVILNPCDQTQYGYDDFMKTINKAIREATTIMNNVRSVPSEQQSKDNDLRAKFSMLKSMLQSIKQK